MEHRTEMLNIWHKLNKGEIDPNITIHDNICKSWARSRKYEVDPFKKTNNCLLNIKEFNKVLAENKEFLDVAIPAMEDIYDFTKNSGFCVALSDKNGIILRIMGDETEIAFTRYSNFVERADWSENTMGTNAVGLVLEIDKPVQVYGYEHFCRCATLSTCSAAPIHDPAGNTLGVLDLTGSFRYVNYHTLGMVYSAAKSIERALLLQKAYSEINLHNSLKNAIMQSITEGLITIDEHNRIILANNRIYKQLGIDVKKCVGQDLAEILPDNDAFMQLINSGKCILGEVVQIKIQNEKKKFYVNCSPLYDENKVKTARRAIVLNELHKVINKIIRPHSNITFDSLIGKSTSFQAALEQAKMAAETSSNVLLLGESGVGKELFAQAIHNASDRQGETFITINCGAIPRELISSELFGYEDGAFTGARKGGSPGKFELADKGTIFLDEIGEMPVDLQATLLRVLEDKSVMRIGGNNVISTNIRLISATNKNLLQEVKESHFRNDLYFRLNVISINIPPLRERQGDIPILVEYFINTISSRLGKIIDNIDPKVLDIFINYDWPGNIRELSNVLERCINLSRNGNITVDLLPQEIKSPSSEMIYVWDKTPTKENVEEQLIRNYLLKFGDNKSDVAKALNMSRSSLYRKMVKYKII